MHPASDNALRQQVPAVPESQTSHSQSLWYSLPGEVARRFRPHADQLAGTILEEIQRAVPEYAQPLEGQFGKVITLGIERAVLNCIDSIEGRGTAQQKWDDLFRGIGRRVYNDGRSLDSLQSAYRVGGRAAWRYVSAFGQKLRLPASMLCVGAEAIFAFVDEISAYSVEGYTMAQARAAGTLERRRQRLLERILATPTSSAQTIAAMAAAAEWPVPESVTLVALEARIDRPHTPAVHADVLLDLEGTQPYLLTPDPKRDLATLESELEGWRAAAGPHVPLAEAATSLHWARRTLDLVHRAILPNAPITRSGDHLSKLLLLSDEFLLRQLSKRALAPLAGLTPKQQVRLGSTLLAWLEYRGSTPEVAEALDIHPQTVRYRLNQLTELFGDRLNTPELRFEMQLSLEAHRLLHDNPLEQQ
ncbi:helix-turn-helix domain-containing protein [Amycolatopsis sp. 195334CR]|uniref:PucR family transcriptional regulator n=1 Tax=Amycolatopsis sp. 195334CR TaxID=2814588 RepID=UPI001A902ED3|nr:helix-turn-helix domain-containing protein [Amycolatopsis sp. 195334CR]MBN6036636.1 helix-turn-helix domain-containing protein [Amycolatopsis sp. 195334CR]